MLTKAPGVLLVMGLALTAKGLATALGDWWMHGQIAPVSPVLCAILLGILWRNLFGLNYWAELGVTRLIETLLPIGIALVGLRLTLLGVKEVGALAIPVVIGCILVALGVSAAIGRALRIAAPLRHLLAVGTAVCGCTAIVATAPVVRAKPEETALALTCVVLIGCAGMLVYPWLAHHLFSPNAQAAGVLLGTSIHDTSQVVGASLIYAQEFTAPDTVAAASLTKLLRNLSLLILVPLIAVATRKRTGIHDSGNTASRVREAIPLFLIAFVLLALARNLGDAWLDESSNITVQWHQVLGIANTVSEYLLIGGMTAVGLSLSLKHVRDIGWRAPAAAVVTAAAVGLTSVLLTSWLRG